MKNYIGISRCIVNHWIYEDAEYFKAWFEMLYRARWKEEDKTELVEGQLVIIKRGYFIFGRQGWSKRLNIGEQRLRTLIKKLIADNMIELVEKHSKFTIYKIINYEKYNLQTNQQESEEQQGLPNGANPQNNLQVTFKQPSANPQLTTKEEREDRGKKEKKDIIGDFTSNEDLKEAIKGFIEMRNKIKEPMTDRAIKLMFGELKKLAADDKTKIEILNQSTVNNWKGVYALKAQGSKERTGVKPDNTKLIRRDDF